MAIKTRETTATGVTNKGSPLTNAEVDNNFVELKQDKLENVVEDTTPQLGGDLDLNSNDITGTGNVSITGSITVSGTVDGRDVSTDGTKLDGIEANATADQTNAEIRAAVEAASDSNVFTDADHSKLDGIEASADVTDATNVAAAGALMDSEVTNLAQVKAFDSSDYATAAQGTKADSALQNVVADTTPQLGGNLDVNGNAIVSASNGDIAITPDGNGKIILDGLNFPTADGSNGQVLQTNGSGQLSFADSSGGDVVDDTTPQLGGDLDVNGNSIVSTSNGNIGITPNGSGKVVLDSNVDVQSGEIAIKNSGSLSNVKFYCEVSNAHYTQLQSSPHSAYSGNVTLTLPPATDTLVGRATTDTLTNKTLTSPTVNGGTHTSFASTGIDDNASSTAITINSSQNVGIGTTSPSRKLFVYDSGTRSDIQLSYGAVGVTDADGVQFGIQSGGAYIWNFEATDLYFGTNNSRRLTIDSSGDVQIHGTSILASSILSVDGSGEVRNGVASKVNNDAYYTYAGINSSGTNTFLVYGSGGIDATSINTTATNVFASASGQPFYWKDTDATNGTNCNIYSYWYAQSTTLGYIGYGSSANSYLYLNNSSVGSLYFGASSANGFLANGSVMWHAGNDGSGSGLDADLWDGNQFSSYLNQAVLTTSNPTFATINYTNALYAYEGSNYVAQDPRWNSSGYNASEGVHHMYCTNASGGTYGQVGMAVYSGSAYVYLTTKSGDSNFYHNNSKMWSAGNDGSGSGLDADTLDGYNSGTGGANTVVRTNSSGYIAHNDWISIGNGTGLFMANGGYFYQDTTYGWYARSPSASNSSIRMQNSSGTLIGWYYCDNAANQGFLTTSGGWSFKVDNSGNATATGNVTAYSDVRLKENIQPLENSLDKVMRLRGVSYTRKDTGSHEIGVIAQEVEDVIPEFVHISDGVATDENALADVRSVDYGRMVSVLIEAIKEQQVQIEELKEAVKWQ